jgi:hypothetical protein
MHTKRQGGMTMEKENVVFDTPHTPKHYNLKNGGRVEYYNYKTGSQGVKLRCCKCRVAIDAIGVKMPLKGLLCPLCKKNKGGGRK